MSTVIIPKTYRSALNLYQTQTAIGFTNRTFEKKLVQALNLKRVSAPLFVEEKTGLNDDLNGVERAVSFSIPETGSRAQIVHSLAKWKRMALHKYGFNPGEGLYTIMNAIRRDETMDNLHSIYVDQWDWEKVITQEERTIDYLKNTVSIIVRALCDTLDCLKKEYPELKTNLCRDVTYITTQELEDMYPDKNPKERENLFVKNHPTTFIMQIGDLLSSGKKHDGRAPDYDDWTTPSDGGYKGLNGDIILWNPVLESAFEVSSMGIRVDKTALLRQLELEGCPERADLEFHKALLEDRIPLSIGGGIGQSRLCMFLLRCAHIGEVQASIWPEEMVETCRKHNIYLK